MTLHGYLAACDSAGISPSRGYMSLEKSFRSGGISYPRCGILSGHAAIEVINSRGCDAVARGILEKSGVEPAAVSISGNTMSGNRFLAIERLRLATPAEIANDIKSFVAEDIEADEIVASMRAGFERREYYEAARKPVDSTTIAGAWRRTGRLPHLDAEVRTEIRKGVSHEMDHNGF